MPLGMAFVVRSWTSLSENGVGTGLDIVSEAVRTESASEPRRVWQ